MNPFKCACRVTDPWQCVEMRYGMSSLPDLDFGDPRLDEREACECPCHDDYRYDDDDC